MRRTVGVAPGTFTIGLNGMPCPPDSTWQYTFSPWGPNPMTNPPGEAIPGPLGPVVVAGPQVILSPYASEAALKGFGAMPRTVFGVRVDIAGVVLGTVVGLGLLVGLLASK